MNWIENLNKALDFIEDNLDKEIDPEEVARAAYTSRFHFQRLFTMVSGYRLGEYIRQRRLSVAVSDLRKTGVKVIDVAMKYGYDSPEAFSKAFKKLHGVSPSTVRKDDKSFQAIPPLRFQLTVKGEEHMNYTIIKKEAFDIIGYKKHVSTKNNENFIELPKFWDKLHGEGKVEELAKAAPDGDVLGVCLNYNDGDEEFDYYIAVRGNDAGSRDEDLVKARIPESTWAVFSHAGELPDAIQNLWKQIYHEWFPATNYQHAGTAELEIYPTDCECPDGMKFEIWIPIIENDKSASK